MEMQCPDRDQPDQMWNLWNRGQHMIERKKHAQKRASGARKIKAAGVGPPYREKAMPTRTLRKRAGAAP